MADEPHLRDAMAGTGKLTASKATGEKMFAKSCRIPRSKKIMKNESIEIEGVFSATHPSWQGPIQFYRDGSMHSPGVDTGKYEFHPQKQIVLHWDHWDSEELFWDDTRECYQSEDGSFSMKEESLALREKANIQNVRQILPHQHGQFSDPGKPSPDHLPLISCVMPTYGRPSYVNEAVQMFLDQDYPNKELIILNDCVGQIYSYDLAPESGVRIFNYSERFSNLGEKRNACIELAKGEYIAVWDDDDIYLPWRLSYSYQKMQEHDTPFYRAQEFWAYWGEEEPFHDNQSVPGWVSHPNTLFTKDLWKQVQGYPGRDVGEDARFFEKIHQFLKQEFITYPIKREERFFIMRGESDYPHMSIAGGSGQLDLEGRNIKLHPKPIANPVLRSRCQILIQEYLSGTKIPD
jgi:hypothetical protein